MAAISIIIPTLNAAASLPACLAALRADGAADDCEIIVSDGGSQDGTERLATAAGARALRAERGRGPQLAAGAAAASAGWFLFLHADTLPAAGWRAALAAHIAEAGEDCAGYFRFALDDEAVAARRLERMVAWRCRALALPYGDQGLLISRGLYERVGGFRPLPLFEDVDLVRRLGRARLRPLAVAAVTSARRYRQAGYLRRSAKNLFCLMLYFVGVKPSAIARIYR